MNSPFNKNLKIITAYLPDGKGFELLEFLHDAGHTTANVHNARGNFIAGPVDKSGQPLDEQKEVLRLKFKEELSYKEIAAVTGYTVNHVGVLIHNTLKSLKSLVAESKEGSVDVAFSSDGGNIFCFSI